MEGRREVGYVLDGVFCGLGCFIMVREKLLRVLINLLRNFVSLLLFGIIVWILFFIMFLGVCCNRRESVCILFLNYRGFG